MSKVDDDFLNTIFVLEGINEGNYKFESIVCKVDDIYHISPEFEIDFQLNK